MADEVYALWYNGKILNLKDYGKTFGNGKPMIYTKPGHAKAALTQVRQLYRKEIDADQVEIRTYRLVE